MKEATSNKARLFEIENIYSLPQINRQTRKVFSNHGITRIAIYQIPLTTQFRGITVREGLLIAGPGGWAEAAPFWDYDPAESARWLRGALQIANEGLPWPADVCPSTVAVRCNVTVPVIEPEKALSLVAQSGAITAKVKVADKRSSFQADCERLRAVRQALGPKGNIRIDVNALWTLEEALEKLPKAKRAAAGLQYAEQPCARVEDLAILRRKLDIPIAADESIRRAEDPLRVAKMEAADVLVVKAMPLGGVKRAAEIVTQAGLPVVVSSALDTSVGLMAGISLATLVGAGQAQSYDCGLATSRLLSGEVLSEPVILEGSYLRPGLCTHKNADLLELKPISDERVAAWIERLNAMVPHLDI